MNPAGIETATRIGCGDRIILFVDAEYGLLSKTRQDHRGEAVGTRVTNPDVMTLAESYRLTHWKQLVERLSDAITPNQMSLVELRLG